MWPHIRAALQYSVFFELYYVRVHTNYFLMQCNFMTAVRLFYIISLQIDFCLQNSTIIIIIIMYFSLSEIPWFVLFATFPFDYSFLSSG